jgi:hypothetical protein
MIAEASDNHTEDTGGERLPREMNEHEGSRKVNVLKGWIELVRKAAESFGPGSVFVALALTAGVYLVFVTGPFQAPDEGLHFLRAFQVSEGGLISDLLGDKAGGLLPMDLKSTKDLFKSVEFHSHVRVDKAVLCRLLRAPFDADDRDFIPFYTSVYCPLMYIPQAAGIAVARWSNASAIVMMYAGRLVNLLCWIAMVFVAIRLTPIFKWVVVLVALMPMSIFLAASLSGDTVISGLTMLLTAAVLRAGFSEKNAIGSRDKMMIVVLCVMVSMVKQVYLPLVGLVLLIPAERFNGGRSKAIFCCIAVGASVLAFTLWGRVIRGMYMPAHGADAPVQLSLILAKPWDYAIVLWHTIVKEAPAYNVSFTGVLGWLDTWLPQWVYSTYPPALAGVALLDKDNGRAMEWPKRVLIVALCMVSFILIEISQYLIWTKPGAPIIEGVQGRYLIPLAVPLLLVLYNRRVAVARWAMAAAVLVYSSKVLFVTCVRVHERYYGWGVN